jgi:hypothetical protein
LDKLPLFDEGIDFLAPGAEHTTAWDSLISLIPLLREHGLENGIKITSKYESLGGDYEETLWTINPIREAAFSFGREKDIKDIVKALENLQRDFHRVVGPLNKELRVSTYTEREERRIQSEEEGS